MVKNTKETDQNLKQVLADIEKQFGKGSIMKLGDNPEFKEDVTSIVSDLKKENENLEQKLEQNKQELKETMELIISMRNIFKQMGNIEQNHVETQEQTTNTNRL